MARKKPEGRVSVVYYKRILGEDDWISSEVTICDNFNEAKRFIDREIDDILIELDKEAVKKDTVFAVNRDLSENKCMFITRTEDTITAHREIIETWQIVESINEI